MTKNINILDNIIHFWLDHLELFWTFKFENQMFEKLDFDNSNYGELENYSFTKNEVPRHKYKIIFTKDNYSLFAYYKWEENSNSVIKSKDKIVIYSTAFKLLWNDNILYFLEWYFYLFKCFRFDICIDLKFETNTILENFNKLNTWKEFIKFWKVETRYIWESNKYKNKRQLIRIYNKILDINEKNKHKLYKNYLIEDNITRIELEIRSELAKNIIYTDLFDNYIISWIFKNYLKKHTNIFDIEWVENLTLFRKAEKKVNQEIYQWTIYKNQRKAIFIWHAKSIYEMWYCPVRVLIWEWLILDDTKKFLDNDIVEIIWEIEIRLKNKELHKRNEIQNRKSSNYKKYD